ncbi:MAG: DNA polymerase II large subunit [Candidatus Anstonellales archaeon]
MEIVADEETKKYFDSLRAELEKAYSVASKARAKGFDPTEEVEIAIAKDVAARVEGILGIEIADEIRRREKEGKSREDIAFELAKEIARGKIVPSRSIEERIEKAVRVGVALLTEGVLVAPTEGIAKIKIKQNPDGSKYVAIYFAGPIRSAGGTVAALSVVLADLARREAGIGDYRPLQKEVDRYVEEINTYEAAVAHLQYKPPEEHIRIIVENCPVCIDGEPTTEDVEVSVNRDLERVETNKIRGGVPLVICEGIAQKAAKVLKYTKKLGIEWTWLEKIIKIKTGEKKIEIKPNPDYLDGLVAGRPVFSYPMAKGGFRLRYGRSRTNGIMAKNIHPAAMVLLDGFIAYGTQLKLERPGKGCVVAANENIEPPIVLLDNGDVVKVRTIQEAEKIKDEVREILFLGDILCPFGDFLKSNTPLLPPGYCEEWWAEEVKAKGVEPKKFSSAKEAIEFSKKHSLPLHPDYLFYWTELNKEELTALATWINSGKFENGVFVVENAPEKRFLERIGAEHKLRDGKVLIENDTAVALLFTLSNFKNVSVEEEDVTRILSAACGVEIRDKGGTFIGARMGRPEKADEREMDGSPNVLFPTGSDKTRSISRIYTMLKEREGVKNINIEVAVLRCTKCRQLTFYTKCHLCGGKAVVEEKGGKKTDRIPIDLVKLMENTKKTVGFMPSEIKGVKGLMSSYKIPERLEKGFIRAKHSVYVYRDGTARFDATDLPLTHFTPREIGVSVQKIKQLGYTRDYLGNPIENEDQLIPLKPQDILLSEPAAEYLFRISKFIDDMLVNLYGLEAFYNLKNKEDLVGHLVVGLSPHTSAGVLARVIGFTKANVGYAHPYFHTAKRRNADGDEDAVMLLLDALINFSKYFLSDKRGGTMDSPLVLTVFLDPREVDDEVHEMETIESYPLEFYKSAMEMKMPYEVSLPRIKDRLGKPEQYSQIPFTHPTSFIDKGVLRTTYVKLSSVPEKVQAEVSLMKKIRAVDIKDAMERLVLSHFIPDLYGNLRKFSRQDFRCVNCNEKYRRVPLVGKCLKCGGNLTLTIHQGGIEKYFDVSMKLVDGFQLPNYLKQRLVLLGKEIKNVFEDEKIKQTGISDFM